MNESMKISIIIPVYNSEKYIEKCLDSVFDQTYQNFEVIIINDGSKDNSDSIIREYKKKYNNKITYINQENIGVAKTRNKAIKMATGDYIAFIDNDDFIDKDYLQVLVENSNNGFYDIVFCGYRRPNENGKIVKKLLVNNQEWTKLLITAPWAKIYKTEYLKDNNLEFLNNNIGEDVYFNLQAILLTKKIRHVDYIGYNWFFNTESVSNSKQKDFEKINVMYLLDSSINKLNEKNIFKDNYDYLELFYFRYIIWFLLFSCKKHTYKEIKILHDKLFNWLSKYFPNYKKSKLIGFNLPKGESKGYQLFYLSYMLMHKLKVDNIFIYIYSRL